MFCRVRITPMGDREQWLHYQALRVAAGLMGCRDRDERIDVQFELDVLVSVAELGEGAAC